MSESLLSAHLIVTTTIPKLHCCCHTTSATHTKNYTHEFKVCVHFWMHSITNTHYVTADSRKQNSLCLLVQALKKNKTVVFPRIFFLTAD